MKRISILLFIVSLSICLNGQITFERSYGGDENDYGRSLVQMDDGGYLVCGDSKSFGPLTQIYVIRTDEYGDTLWTRAYFEPYATVGKSIIKNSSNEYVICGYISGNEITSTDVYLLCIDEFGDMLWTKTFPEYNNQYGHSVIEATDGGYLITGEEKINGSPHCILLIKTNIIGDTLWTKRISLAGASLRGKQTIQTFDNGFMVLGLINSDWFIANDYVVKTDEVGNILWDKIITDYFITNSGSIIQTSDSGYVIAGSCSAGGNEGNFLYDVFLKKMGQSGANHWKKTYGVSYLNEFVNHAQLTSDNGFIITGVGWQSNNNVLKLIKTDMNGNEEWTRSKPGHGIFVSETTDSGYIVVSRRSSANKDNDMDVWLIKTDGVGMLTSIDNESINDRLNIYPNPANNYFIIDYPYTEKALIVIYNNSGEIVFQKWSNDPNCKIDISYLNSGLYFIAINTVNNTIKQKLVKL